MKGMLWPVSLAVYRQTSFIRGESNNYEDDGWKRPWPEDEIISTERLLRGEEAGHIWEEGVSVAYLIRVIPGSLTSPFSMKQAK